MLAVVQKMQSVITIIDNIRGCHGASVLTRLFVNFVRV
jgi:hypothetical protein